MSKICKYHGELTEEKRYYFNTRKGTRSYRCKPCMNARSKRFKILNPDYFQNEAYKIKHNMATKEWAKNNPEKVKANNKKHQHKANAWYLENKNKESYKIMKRKGEARRRADNIEKYREMERRKATNQSLIMSNCYLNRVIKLRGLTIMQEEIRPYIKAIIQLKRKIKNIKGKVNVTNNKHETT